MKVLIKAAIGLMCLVNVAYAGITPPDELISSTVKDVTAIVKQDKDIQTGNQKKILELVDAKVLPHFDFSRMTQLAVGKSWRTATPEQKTALTTEFRNMLVRTYTKAFTLYKDQVVEVTPAKLAADAKEVTVKTKITKAGSPPIPVNYEMIKKDDGWKAYDVIIEGVSMVTSYRGTFASEIQANGIDGLIKMLASKNAAPTAVASNKKEAK